MEAVASTENRKQPRFPATAWKTLRVSHSSHGPRPPTHQRQTALMPLMPSAILTAPHPRWPYFQPFPPGRVSTSGDTERR
jgi:hypothetical protein